MRTISNGARLQNPRSTWFDLPELLSILRPIIGEFFFYVGEFEAVYRGSEASAWAELIVDFNAPIIRGTEPILLSFKNLMFFAENTEYLHEWSIWFTSKGSAISTGDWEGGVEDDLGLKIAFATPSMLEESIRLMASHGYILQPEDGLEPPNIPTDFVRGSYRQAIRRLQSYWEEH